MTKLSKLEDQYREIDSKMAAINKQIAGLHAQVGPLFGELEALEEQRDEIGNELMEAGVDIGRLPYTEATHCLY